MKALKISFLAVYKSCGLILKQVCIINLKRGPFLKFLKWKKFSVRSYIQMHFKLGISAKQVHSELKKIDEDAPTIQTVHNLFHLFKKG